MASGVGYFADGYFASNYWASNYWAPTGEVVGDYWADRYWASDYWASNYWAESTTDPGDIRVSNAEQLTLTDFVTQIQSGPGILATTPVLTLGTFQTDANWDIDPPVTAPSLPLAAFGVGVGTAGYILGDITLTFAPESTVGITYGMAPGVAARNLTTQKPITTTPDGLDVAVGNTAGLTLTEWPILGANTIEVEPVPQSLTLTPFNSPAAGIGVLADTATQSLTLNAPTHGIDAQPATTVGAPQPARLALDRFNPSVFGRRELALPIPTWPGDSSIVNLNADIYPSNYEICDRTGFKLRRGQLKKEWTGVMVRPESFERRNVQDLVRGVGDEQEGSPRPEQDDRFVDDEHPMGVSAADL